MEISELIEQIEAIYNKFMISDNTPDMEADLKIKLLDSISSTLAFCNLRTGPNSENLKAKLNDLKDKLLVWDPFGPWFKENKELPTITYDVITLAKTIEFEKEVLPANIVNIEDFNAFKNAIQIELQNIKKDINSLKVLIKNIRSLKPKLTPKPIETPESTPILEVVPDERDVSMVQPVPIPKPVSAPQTVPIPKPVSAPQTIPIPKPVAAAKSTEVPVAKPTEKKDSSKLYDLFSKPITEPVQVVPVKPSPSAFKSVTPVPIPKPTPKPVPIQPKPVRPALMKSVTPKLVPIKPVEISVPELDVIAPEPAVPESDDPEALYHELISLQGKRYGLERSIKDLKALHQSGSLTEDEYKQKLSSKLDDLKKISANIERIREKLD